MGLDAGFGEVLAGAIADPQGWDALLAHLASECGATSAGLLLTAEGRTRFHSCSVHTSAEIQRAYETDYEAIDPLPGLIGALAPGTASTIARAFPEASRRRHPFFAEWAIPNQMGEAVYARLPDHLGGVQWLCLAWPIDRGGEEVDRLVEDLGPTLRAISVALDVSRRLTMAGLAGARIDRPELPDAVAHVGFGQDGRVVHACTAARSLRAGRDGIAVGTGRLIAATPEDQRRLDRALASLFNPHLPVPMASVVVEGRDRRIACVDLLRAGGGAPYPVEAFVTIDEPLAPEDLSALSERFGLTPSEVRVACHIAHGTGLAAVAQSLGVALATVRVHAQRTYDKCGVHSRAELTALVHRMRRRFRRPKA